MPRPSKRAVEFIISFEVTSRGVYERRYRSVIWPEGQSGITIGVGYDLGYVTRAEMVATWGPHLAPAMIEALKPAVGKKGADAKALLAELKPQVDVPWEAAYAVFRDKTLPKFEAATISALPNTDRLSPDSFGALVSLTFNRGPSYGRARSANDPTDRYREMRAIKSHMTARDFAAIPAEIRAMQRIWPTVAGLQRRRREEAKLFADGLD